jgi:succinoglycan biosynthesis protein ExoM
VENDDTGNSKHIVDEIASTSPFPIAYALEPRLGIPIARNRTLDLALELGADWIAFIDDDEYAPPSWIALLVAAAKTLKADVVHGPVDQFSAETEELVPVKERKCHPTGLRLKTAATNNTLMRAHIAAPDGMGLRFNEEMRFTGGSDSHYFYLAADRGAEIRWVEDAPVVEYVPAERLTLRWRLQRERRVAANKMYTTIRRRGRAYAITRGIPKWIGRIGRGSVQLPAGALVYLVNGSRGWRMMMKAMLGFSSVVGAVGVLINVMPQPYSTVEGF